MEIAVEAPNGRSSFHRAEAVSALQEKFYVDGAYRGTTTTGTTHLRQLSSSYIPLADFIIRHWLSELLRKSMLWIYTVHN